MSRGFVRLPTEPARYTNAEHAVDEWVKDEWSTTEELDATLDALIEDGTFDEQWWPEMGGLMPAPDEPMFRTPQMEDLRTGKPWTHEGFGRIDQGVDIDMEFGLRG